MNMFARVNQFRTIVFDAEELQVICKACTSLAEHDRRLLDEAADNDLDQYLSRVKMANMSDMTDSLVALFKPEQEILIEPEDLKPILSSLELHRKNVCDAHGEILERAIQKIETCLP